MTIKSMFSILLGCLFFVSMGYSKELKKPYAIILKPAFVEAHQGKSAFETQQVCHFENSLDLLRIKTSQDEILDLPISEVKEIVVNDGFSFKRIMYGQVGAFSALGLATGWFLLAQPETSTGIILGALGVAMSPYVGYFIGDGIYQSVYDEPLFYDSLGGWQNDYECAKDTSLANRRAMNYQEYSAELKKQIESSYRFSLNYLAGLKFGLGYETTKHERAFNEIRFQMRLTDWFALNKTVQLVGIVGLMTTQDIANEDYDNQEVVESVDPKFGYSIGLEIGPILNHDKIDWGFYPSLLYRQGQGFYFIDLGMNLKVQVDQIGLQMFLDNSSHGHFHYGLGAFYLF